MKRVIVSHRKGDYEVEAEALLLGSDVVVSVWGGSIPHVGAVAMAIPRPSLKDPAIISSTSSVLTSAGHKEDEIVKPFSEILAAALNSTVVVAAGIHWEHLPDGDARTVRSLCAELAGQLKEKILRERG